MLKNQINVKAAAFWIAVFFFVIGFCLQPWLSGIAIGIILACNMKPQKKPQYREIRGVQVEVTPENREQLLKDVKDETTEKRHQENIKTYKDINLVYLPLILKRDYNFKEWYELNPYQYPSLIKNLTPEMSIKYKLSSDWIKEREAVYLKRLDLDGWTRKIKSAKENYPTSEQWWDITEPLINEQRFNDYRKEYDYLIKALEV